MNEITHQGRFMRRLEAMGIHVRRMPGGRCVLASMQNHGRPLETLNGSIPVTEFVFSTVGSDQIKCLRPLVLFALPLIRIAGCTTAALLETRIRSSWAAHMKRLRSAEDWLRNLGSDVSAANSGAILSVSIAGERRSLELQVNQARRVILPGRGLLSGVSLLRAEDRVLEIDPCIDSAVDLEIVVVSRLQELARLDKRLKENRRREAMSTSSLASALQEISAASPLRILLVGPRLANEHSCIDSLRLRKYEVKIARNLNEAVECYDHVSPELVIADINLGRSDGIELISSLRRIVGIEEIPVILVDDHHRSRRRTVAKKAGALGYLTYPIEISRIANRLEEMIKRPKRRRFTRYPQRMAVKIAGSNLPSTALAIGRGGLMIRTEDQFSIQSIQSCDLVLSNVGKHLQFDAKVLYQMTATDQQEIGLQFQSLSPPTEANLIDYLHCLH